MRPHVRGAVFNLWRAVDHEGEVLESFATKDRDKAAALKFMKKLMKRHGSANHFSQERHLVGRQTYKERRSAALAEWRSVMG